MLVTEREGVLPAAVSREKVFPLTCGSNKRDRFIICEGEEGVDAGEGGDGVERR